MITKREGREDGLKLVNSNYEMAEKDTSERDASYRSLMQRRKEATLILTGDTANTRKVIEAKTPMQLNTDENLHAILLDLSALPASMSFCCTGRVTTAAHNVPNAML